MFLTPVIVKIVTAKMLWVHSAQSWFFHELYGEQFLENQCSPWEFSALMHLKWRIKGLYVKVLERATSAL